MREFFEPKQLGVEAKSIITKVIDILDEYHAQGYDLTLRQVYYQLVARDWFPEDRKWRQVRETGKWVRDPNGTKNAEPNYDWLGGIVASARLCGYIDWTVIVDRTRDCAQNAHWQSPSAILDACAKQFRYNTWTDQPWHVECMVEKDALEGILLPACRDLDIPFSANRGYSSLSAMYEAGKRLKSKLDDGKHICIIYLGDHDPSGIDMSRDIEDRLRLFSGYSFYQPPGSRDQDPVLWEKAYSTLNPRYFKRWRNFDYSELQFKVERVALNMDQIQELRPPPQPAKTTDSRAASYIEQFGEESWELDALEPSVLVQLVEDKVAEYRDEALYERALERQEEARLTIKQLAATMDAEGLKERPNVD